MTWYSTRPTSGSVFVSPPGFAPEGWWFCRGCRPDRRTDIRPCSESAATREVRRPAMDGGQRPEFAGPVALARPGGQVVAGVVEHQQLIGAPVGDHDPTVGKAWLRRRPGTTGSPPRPGRPPMATLRLPGDLPSKPGNRARAADCRRFVTPALSRVPYASRWGGSVDSGLVSQATIRPVASSPATRGPAKSRVVIICPARCTRSPPWHRGRGRSQPRRIARAAPCPRRR